MCTLEYWPYSLIRGHDDLKSASTFMHYSITAAVIDNARSSATPVQAFGPRPARASFTKQIMAPFLSFQLSKTPIRANSLAFSLCSENFACCSIFYRMFNKIL
jgi:hypothetical protein